LKRLFMSVTIPLHSSPPARGRGLKPFLRIGHDQRIVSPPARGRGLKHLSLIGGNPVDGRPPRGGVD